MMLLYTIYYEVLVYLGAQTSYGGIMIEKYPEFYKIKEMFERTGTITVDEIRKIQKITEMVHMEKEEDWYFIDNLTNYLMDNKNYQDAFFILNNCAKKFKSKYRDFFGIKLTLVRIKALVEDKKIELQINPNHDAKSYDHYELLENGWSFLESHLESIIKKQDARLINRAQEVMNEIMMGKGILEERFGRTAEDQKPKNGYGEAILDAGVIIEDITFESGSDSSKGPAGDVVAETDSTKKVDSVVNGDGVMSDDKKRRDDETVVPIEGMPEELTLETVTEQLELLEGELVNPLNDVYTHLYILLKIVKLQYDKIKLLDAEIVKKREELEKLERIFGDEVSLAGLELLTNGDTLSRKKADTQADIDFLIRNKDEHFEEFIQNKKKAQEAIDALDRG